jgi:DNA-binding beta-propeller fold protein YncE
MIGAASFRIAAGWEQLPSGFTHDDVSDVAVDADDNVYLLTRRSERVIVYSSDGRFLSSWGEGQFGSKPHGITVGPDGSVYCVDETNHVVRRYAKDGSPRGTIGSGDASSSGFDGSISSFSERLASVRRGAPPFNLPTKVALAPNGDLYVTDGYGNCRVHHFNPSGALIRSWGEPGSGPGQFRLPHHALVLDGERLLICDRENDRIQVFDMAGRFITEWTEIQRPAAVASGPDGMLYVAEMPWLPGDLSYRHGRILIEQPGRVSVLDNRGRQVERWTTPAMVGPHGIAVDSHGDIYLAEATYSLGINLGRATTAEPTFRKFVRCGRHRS